MVNIIVSTETLIFSDLSHWLMTQTHWLIWLINTLHSANTVAKSTGMILKCSFFIPKKSLCMLCRVLKRLCHVAMALKNSVLNKLTFQSKWWRYLSHCCFLSFQTKSIKKGENHFNSDHVEAFSYQQGVLQGEVQASTKKVDKVTVS